jgi:hypothetical protein
MSADADQPDYDEVGSRAPKAHFVAALSPAKD